MFAVIFEVKPKIEGKETYLEIAAGLRDFLKIQDLLSPYTLWRVYAYRALQFCVSQSGLLLLSQVS